MMPKPRISVPKSQHLWLAALSHLLILQPLGFVYILVFTEGELSIIATVLQKYSIFLLNH